MNVTFFRLGVFLSVLGLAACTKPKPSTGLLDEAIRKTLPAHLAATGKSYQFSPIKEVLGTTLPEGSYQIDISTKVTAKEPLYTLVSFGLISHHDDLPAALSAELPELKSLAEWSYSSSFSVKRENAGRERPRLQPFLLERAKAGEEKLLWVKLLAEPRGTDWLISVVEGEPQAAFAPARPRAAFDPRLAIFGTKEQQQNLADVKTAFAFDQRRIALLKKIEPEIDALKKNQLILEDRYYQAASAKLQKTIVDSRAANHERGERMEKILAQGDAAHDNYKTRNRLQREESQRSQVEADAFNEKIKTLQQEADGTRQRAKDETEAKIRELKKQNEVDDES